MCLWEGTEEFIYHQSLLMSYIFKNMKEFKSLSLTREASTQECWRFLCITWSCQPHFSNIKENFAFLFFLVLFYFGVKLSFPDVNHFTDIWFSRHFLCCFWLSLFIKVKPAIPKFVKKFIKKKDDLTKRFPPKNVATENQKFEVQGTNGQLFPLISGREEKLLKK